MHANRLPHRTRPTAASLAQQSRGRYDWRQEVLQRHYLPCWLASFVLHMVLMILLASVILPEVKDPFLRPLLLSFATNLAKTPRSPPQPVLITRDVASTGSDQDQPDPAKVDVALEPPASPPPVERPLAASPEPQPNTTAVDPTLTPAANAPSDTVAMPIGNRQLPVRFLNASSQSAMALALRSVLDNSPKQVEHDQIVDRFIEFDIGRLTGAAGAQARREFEELGPDSIPALVRGLNRSASIHATCPVCVITTKLQTALAKNDDRTLFAYAVANIGRDVPEKAPHRGRLMSFLDSLTDSPDALLAALADPDLQVKAKALEQLLDQHGALKPNEQQEVGDALADLIEGDPTLRLAAHRVLLVMSAGQPGAPTEETLAEGADVTARLWRTHWLRVARGEELKRAAPHELHAALKSSDPTVCQAAACAISVRKVRVSDGQKLFLARELIHMLSAADLLSRDLAQHALAKLAGQQRSLRVTAAEWTRFWDDHERENLIGPRAHAYLSMAERLEARGQLPEAIDRYNRLLSEFPNTAAAGQARERLSQLAVKRK